MLKQGSVRELLALNSMRVIAGGDATASRTIDMFLKLVDERERRLYEE